MNVSRWLIHVRARQRLGVQLARGQHDLAVLAVDQIAVVVDRVEIVVRADFLDLAERVEQRQIVPQRHVVERGRVARDVRRRQRCITRDAALFDADRARRLSASPRWNAR